MFSSSSENSVAVNKESELCYGSDSFQGSQILVSDVFAVVNEAAGT